MKREGRQKPALPLAFESWDGPPVRDLFASIDRVALVEAPYPHFVIENAIPADLADTLLADMPELDVFTRGAPRGSNVRFPLPSAVAFADARISDGWKTALAECNAAMGSLLRRLVERLGEQVLEAYPDFASRFGAPSGLRAVPRANRNRAHNEVGMDAQMVVNTPALADGTRVRGPHLDQPDKLISGLLYLRSPDDDSTGAELELYEPLTRELKFDERNGVPLDVVRRVHTYPYRHNLLVLPLNTPMALHGVSPRSQTPKPRYHIHLVGEMSEPLFTVPR